jgi:hypothetical protein
MGAADKPANGEHIFQMRDDAQRDVLMKKRYLIFSKNKRDPLASEINLSS